VTQEPPAPPPPPPRPGPQENWKRRNPPGVISDGNDRVLREVTVVITDVEGSTELWEWDHGVMTVAQEIHDNVMRDLISRCALHLWEARLAGSNPGQTARPAGLGRRAVLDRTPLTPRASPRRPCASRYCGFEVTTEGDSFTVAFHDAFDAVSWALAMQQVQRGCWGGALFVAPLAAPSLRLCLPGPPASCSGASWVGTRLSTRPRGAPLQAMLDADWPEALLSHEKACVVLSTVDDSSRPGQLLFRGLRVRVAISTGERAAAVAPARARERPPQSCRLRRSAPAPPSP
jgi:hypothetical protein